MARQHAGTAVICERHKEVVNIRTAGAASKCSAGNTIRIRIRSRPNSLKPLFGTPLMSSTLAFPDTVIFAGLSLSNDCYVWYLCSITKSVFY